MPKPASKPFDRELASRDETVGELGSPGEELSLLIGLAGHSEAVDTPFAADAEGNYVYDLVIGFRDCSMGPETVHRVQV